jgi:hypothetical protein
MRSKAAFLVLVIFISGCSPEAIYAAPVDSEVAAAYRSGIEGKIAAWKPEAAAPSAPDGQIDSPGEYISSVDSTVRFAKSVGTVEVLRRNLENFAGAKVQRCTWGALDLNEVKESERPDYVIGADYAYRCAVETFHRSAEGNGVLAYAREGFLFKTGESFSWIEVDHGPSRYAQAGELGS